MTEEDNNFELVDQIESDAYTVLSISCTICHNAVMADEIGVQSAHDPMISWAKEFAKKARGLGWCVSKHGSILCPNCRSDYN